MRGGPVRLRAGLSAAPSWMLAASDPDDKSFGRDLRVIPDVDGDGYAELLVATWSPVHAEAPFGFRASPSCTHSTARVALHAVSPT